MPSLYETLQTAKTEEDVKDAYIAALGLRKYTKGLVDIRTDEIWFEAKNKGTISTYKIFTQLLHYVQDALNKSEPIPPFLAAVDTEKAALMRTADVLPFLKKRTIKWGKSATQFPQEALDEVSAFIGTYLISFRLATQEAEFIRAAREAIATGKVIRIPITPANLKQVFDRWVEMVGREIGGVPPEHYALLFFADIMSDGHQATHEDLPAQMLHKNDQPVFLLNGQLYELGNKEGYRQFWNIYHRPPEEEYRNYLLERRDSLIPLDARSFKGAFYTPLHIVDKAYDKLAEVLGKNWQREYIVWDMCCGVGNLEVKHSNHRNIFMSTLDKADIDIMVAAKTCVAAQRFQYDYLNDDIDAFGRIDYDLTNKVPAELRAAIAQGKKILVLMNPPYAEATNANNASLSARGKETWTKKEVAATKVAAHCMQGYGKASNELFTQFLARIALEIPNATVALFSKLKYVNAPNFEDFRAVWNARYLGGFITHSKAFDGLKGDFPIGFLVWETDNRENPPLTPPLKRGGLGGGAIDSITTEVIDKTAAPIGEKTFYNLPNSTFLNVWIKRPRANKQEVVPLKNAISVYTVNERLKNWSDNAIAYMNCAGNDLQQSSKLTSLYSSTFGNGNGFYITPENLWQAAIVFSVRRLIRPTWINDRDQFLQPTQPLPDDFKTDCLIWMLFNGSNLTASADGLEWDGRTWSVVNHFIPYTEAEVGARGRFASDFMARYLADKVPSPEAAAVLDAGRDLWRAYHADTDPWPVRDALKLGRKDVGWYQIRNALKRRERAPDFAPFEAAYADLTAKLAPQVYELGFLRA
jgi:hypothetical protein